MRRRSFSSEASSIEDEISFANDVSRHSSAGDHDDSKSISTFFTETLDLQSQPWSVDENQDIVGSLVDDDIDYSAFSSSFMDMKFMSPVTNNIIETQKSLEVVAKSAVPSSYEPTAVFPCSVLSSDSWNDAKFAKDAVIQGILKISHESRSPKQELDIVQWLMSVWPMAATMSINSCDNPSMSAALTRVMKYVVSPERAKLVVEGQPAEHMYIVFSGKVHRETAELGIVGYGDIGYLFGDGALSDLHAIYKETVIAQSEVHCLTLQKSDIDRLSQDAEINEKIEDLRAIKKCSLFTMWSRAQAERLLQTGYRKTYSPGQYINRQNETPDFLYLILEGIVDLTKEVEIINRNRWPEDLNRWNGISRKKLKSYVIDTLGDGALIGDVDILKMAPCDSSARAQTKCLLLCLDKEEFLRGSQDMKQGSPGDPPQMQSRSSPNNILQEAAHEISGGPSSRIVHKGNVIKPLDVKEVKRKRFSNGIDRKLAEKSSKLSKAPKEDNRISIGKAAFAAYDSTGSGVISIKDLRSLMKNLGVSIHQSEAIALIDKFEKENSGYQEIAFLEFKHMLNILVNSKSKAKSVQERFYGISEDKIRTVSPNEISSKVSLSSLGSGSSSVRSSPVRISSGYSSPVILSPLPQRHKSLSFGTSVESRAMNNGQHRSDQLSPPRRLRTLSDGILHK